MKRLNRYYPMCPLNIKLRSCYYVKQVINNSDIREDRKRDLMKDCDREINQCWRDCYSGKKGYEIG